MAQEKSEKEISLDILKHMGPRGPGSTRPRISARTCLGGPSRPRRSTWPRYQANMNQTVILDETPISVREDYYL